MICIHAVTTKNYIRDFQNIPPIILGEETVNGITRQWIIDGLQRSSSLSLFRYGNTRITTTVDESIIAYQREMLDENGNPKRDEHGEIIWETAECDIRNKTYDQLPEELQDRFNEYQIEAAIHQNCDQTEISKLVRKYNNHVAMNQAQKAFTYIDTFAKEIREITENRFFKDIYTCSHQTRINGTLERVVGDMVLLCNYPGQYRKDTKVGFKWLNENATLHDFESLDNLLARLTVSVENTTEVKTLFNRKNTYIFVAAFKAFTETGRKDTEFGKFLSWFVNGGNSIEIDGKTWESLDINYSTKDSGIVHGKLDYLVALFGKYFQENRQAA